MMSNADRTQLLNNLKAFIDEQKNWLQNTLDFVGWNISDLETLVETDKTEFVPCSINPEHRIPREMLLKHEVKCEKRNGDFPKIPDASDLEVTIDVENVTHSVEDCKGESNDDVDPNKVTKNKDERKGDSICLIELLAAERDAKRRRAAHRGKRVHSNKKSYVEVLREVVASQMETLNEGSKVETGLDVVEPESSQKTIIQPHFDSYLGVGSKCYNGNPFKRWKHIEEEEKELIEEFQSGKGEKKVDRDRHRESSNERYKQREKSKYHYDNLRGEYRKYREHSKDNIKYRDNRFDDVRDYYSKKCDEKSSLRYDNENCSKKKSHKDRLEEKHRDEYFSDSYESADRYKKREKRSRERSHDSSEKHKKKRKNKSRERSNDSYDFSSKHNKKHKKRSHERSVHKKKHRKSKHHDSDAE